MAKTKKREKNKEKRIVIFTDSYKPMKSGVVTHLLELEKHLHGKNSLIFLKNIWF